MANNRMSIECVPCGECLTLAKHLCSGYYVYEDLDGAKGVVDRLNRFFDSHAWCGSTDDGIGGRVNLRLAYEIHPDPRFEERGLTERTRRLGLLRRLWRALRV